MVVVMIIAGLAALVLGAELLVRAAKGIAYATATSSMVVGLTIIAFGTSMPELAVTLKAVMTGHTDIALGTIVGSNTYNVLFILGVSATVIPLMITMDLVRYDVPIMILASVAVFVLGMDGIIDRTDGLVLLAGMALYLVRLWFASSSWKRRSGIPLKKHTNASGKDWFRMFGMVLAGSIALVGGARFLVSGLVDAAQSAGIDELVSGLTIAAIGTSLPETFASLSAAFHRERDLAVGNIIGSNIFNIFAIFGLGAVMAPAGIHIPGEAIHFDIPVMIAGAVVCMPIFFTGSWLGRGEGIFFVLYYVVFAVYLAIGITHREMLDGYLFVSMLYVVPLTVVTFLLTIVRDAFFQKVSDIDDDDDDE